MSLYLLRIISQLVLLKPLCWIVRVPEHLELPDSEISKSPGKAQGWMHIFIVLKNLLVYNKWSVLCDLVFLLISRNDSWCVVIICISVQLPGPLHNKDWRKDFVFILVIEFRSFTVIHNSSPDTSAILPFNVILLPSYSPVKVACWKILFM